MDGFENTFEENTRLSRIAAWFRRRKHVHESIAPRACENEEPHAFELNQTDNKSDRGSTSVILRATRQGSPA